MGDKTSIEWTRSDDGSPGATWNPLVGCSRTSPGCDNCYAERDAGTRLRNVPAYAGLVSDGEWTGEVRYLADRLDQPTRWRRPRRIFVNSMSDLFHPAAVGMVDDRTGLPVLALIVAEMVANPRHTFQVLTKRAKLMAGVLRQPQFALDVNAALLVRGHAVMPGFMSQPFDMWGRQRHIWWGVSIESQQYAFRAQWLLDTPAAVRWVSAEPLLGPLDLTDYLHESTCELAHPTEEYGYRPGPCTCAAPYEDRIDWIVAGGESGRAARPMHPSWARSLRDQAQAAPATAFLFKQWGEYAPARGRDYPSLRIAADGRTWTDDQPVPDAAAGASGVAMHRYGKHEAGRELDGRTWDQYPA